MDLKQADQVLQRILEALDDLDDVTTFEAPKTLEGQRVLVTRDPWEGRLGTVVTDPYFDGPDYPEGFIVVLLDPPESIQVVLDRADIQSTLRESEDIGDVTTFEEPSVPTQEIRDAYLDLLHNGSHGAFDTALSVANDVYDGTIDVYDVVNAFAEAGDEETAQEIIEDME